MTTEDIIAAWKGEKSSSSAPTNPAGERFTEISEADLQNVSGGDICFCIPCEGYVTTISGECNRSGDSCNPF